MNADVSTLHPLVDSFLAIKKKVMTFRGKDFGRSIDQNLASISETGSIACITIRKRETAVVIPIEKFNEINALVAKCAELVAESEARKAAEFDRLWNSLNGHSDQSTYSHREVSTDRLNESY